MSKRKNPVNPKMHTLVWGTLDALAAKYGVSISAMARRATLDPTAFNISKRTLITGLRMPTMASICAVLEAFNITWDEWAEIWKSLQEDKK